MLTGSAVLCRGQLTGSHQPCRETCRGQDHSMQGLGLPGPRDQLGPWSLGPWSQPVPVPVPDLAVVTSPASGLVLVQQPYQSWPSSASPPASEPPPPNLLPAPGRAAAPTDDRGVAHRRRGTRTGASRRGRTRCIIRPRHAQVDQRPWENLCTHGHVTHASSKGRREG